MKNKQLDTVGDLIDHLQQFDRSKPLTIEEEGNTFPLEADDVQAWDESDPDSPVAIYIR